VLTDVLLVFVFVPFEVHKRSLLGALRIRQWLARCPLYHEDEKSLALSEYSNI
jgi:hypothetical protein